MSGPRRVFAPIARLSARTPLRIRLVAVLLVLVIAALAGSFAVATATLRSDLIDRVDAQLASVAGHPAAGDAVRHPDGDHRGGGPPDGNHLPSAYVLEITDASGTIVYGPTSNLVDSREALPQFPHPTGAQSAKLGTVRFTVDAVRGDEEWRVLAQPVTLSDGSSGTLMVAQGLGDVHDTVGQLTVLFLVIGVAAVAVVAGLGYVVVRASLRPLREVERTAADIAAGDLSHRVPEADPRTEVGHLSGALNRMLGEIEIAFAERAASEDRMRRFVADASHELRTPLTSIRGFAELYRQGAASEDADIRRMMSRIEDEAKRMGLLVEDLLMLARMDEERPLTSTPVDLLVLAGDAVHAARAIAPDRTIDLEVGDTDPPPVAIGDEARLHQVLANLLANALRHTPAGTPVHVRVETRRDPDTGSARATVSVRDEGPGMSAEHAAHIFERFYRADSARNRREGGTGLGLAIVAALVAAHSGTIEVDTAPGEGACFRVTLPVAASAPPAS